MASKREQTLEEVDSALARLETVLATISAIFLVLIIALLTWS